MKPTAFRVLLKTFAWWTLSVSLISCASQKDFEVYSHTIAKFQTATNTTSNAASDYILSANAFVREIEFKRLESDPARELNLPKLIQGPYDPAAIQVRQEAFGTLNAYTELLAALAESDAPTRWKAAAGRLGANVEVFATSLDEHADAGLKDSPLLNLLGDDGPLSRIVTLVGTEFINRSRAEALDDAISNAKPAIDTISDALRRDFRRAVELREVDASDKLLEAAIAYRKAQQAALTNSSKEADRIRSLSGLRSAIETYDNKMAELGRVVQALDAFDQAHDQLVDYAQSDRGAGDLGELIVVINRYAAVAENLSVSLEAGRASSEDR